MNQRNGTPGAAGPPTGLRSALGLWRLMTRPGVGAVRAVRLAAAFGTWAAMAAAPLPALRALGGTAGVALAGTAEPAERLPEAPGVEVVGRFDARYPRPLLDLPDPPALLWIRGRLAGCGPPQRTIAVVGTRTPDRRGVRAARWVAERCANRGLAVVSGLALGIDAAAHEAVLAAGGVTVAVIASGVDVPTPQRHHGLAAAIVGAGGAVVAEVPPGTPVTAAALVARDRIQAALSGTVVIAQTDLGSGTMHTARFALALGRTLAVVAPPDRPSRAGPVPGSGAQTAWAQASPAAGAPSSGAARTDVARAGGGPGDPDTGTRALLAHPPDPRCVHATGQLARRLATRQRLANVELRTAADVDALLAGRGP